MMLTPTLDFDAPNLLQTLSSARRDQLDALAFGVIGFDEEGVVQRYNRHEADMAGFDVEEVIGQHLFVELAPCLNNYLVAERFEQHRHDGEALDTSLHYVLTFRMRPTRVRLRLLWAAREPLCFVLIQRLGAGAPR